MIRKLNSDLVDENFIVEACGDFVYKETAIKIRLCCNQHQGRIEKEGMQLSITPVGYRNIYCY